MNKEFLHVVYARLSRWAPFLVPAAKLSYYLLFDRTRLYEGLRTARLRRRFYRILSRLERFHRAVGKGEEQYLLDKNNNVFVASKYGVYFSLVKKFGLRNLELNGTNDRVQLEFILRNFPPDGVFVDVGASYGYYALTVACRFPESRIFAYEPAPYFFDHLIKNMECNGAENVIAFNAAVGDLEGEFEAVFDSFNLEFIRRMPPEVEKIKTTSHVPCETMDALLRRERLARLDYIKADVEGAELLVLKGAREVLTRFRPIVQLELVSAAARNRYGYELEEVFSIFEDLGYSYLFLTKKKALEERGPLEKASSDRRQDMLTATEFFFVPQDRLDRLDLVNDVQGVSFPYFALRLTKKA